MTKSTRSQTLRGQLKGLDAVLAPQPGRGGAVPMAPKINEGDDRWGGYP